jgi:hypothetical protein
MAIGADDVPFLIGRINYRVAGPMPVTRDPVGRPGCERVVASR